MRRKSGGDDESYQVPEQTLQPARQRAAASKAGLGVIQPIYASGGMSYWLSDAGTDYFPQPDGVQLVTHLYIPKGRHGFLKEIRIAPYCPAPLCDPWLTTGANQPSWRAWNRQDEGNSTEAGSGFHQPAMGTLWSTPMGWETAWDTASVILPSWNWTIRFFQGNLDVLRGQGFMNIPPFNIADPTSWYLVPSIPVPARAYPAGLPGSSVGPSWDAQRMQILTGDKVNFHVPVPQDTTVLLFARWSQDAVWARGEMGTSPMITNLNWSERLRPIGPSVGSLLGYTQPMGTAAATENLETGWGG
jgi:hypothetical protein